jgi:hypothetical protein
VDLTPAHVVHDLVRNVLSSGEEVVEFLDRAQPITAGEHSEMTVAALVLAVAAMLEAVQLSGEVVTTDQVLDRVALRVLDVS